MQHLCSIVQTAIDTAGVTAAISSGSDGAVATFAGVVRNQHRGRGVTHLEYHAYPEMAQEELERIAAELEAEYQVGRIGLVHRTGRLAVGEVSVLAVVAAPHRRAALACCAAAIEAIKQRLPVWKKEFFSDGSEPEWIFGPDENCATRVDDD